MAIGDAVSAFLGAATVNRQPASGVEEQISAIVKLGTNDVIAIYNGSTALDIINAGAATPRVLDDSAVVQHDFNNIAIMITNAVYLRKLGTTDIVQVSGVQTNA